MESIVVDVMGGARKNWLIWDDDLMMSGTYHEDYSPGRREKAERDSGNAESSLQGTKKEQEARRRTSDTNSEEAEVPTKGAQKMLLRDGGDGERWEEGEKGRKEGLVELEKRFVW